MDDESREARGKQIQARRLRDQFKTPTAFAEAVGVDWQTIERAEAGESRKSTYDMLEAWLDDFEEEAGLDDPVAAPVGPVEITMHGVYGVDEIIAKGDPDQVAEAVGRILDRLKQQRGDG